METVHSSVALIQVGIEAAPLRYAHASSEGAVMQLPASSQVARFSFGLSGSAGSPTAALLLLLYSKCVFMLGLHGI